MMKYYMVTLETLAPVYVGSGEEISKIDYAYSEQTGIVYVMDSYKLFSGLQEHHLLEKFEKSLNGKVSLTSFFKEANISNVEYKKWAAYSYCVQNKAIRPKDMTINACVKDAYGKPYIPGSSLKGALRTAIAYGKIDKNRKAYQKTAVQVSKDSESKMNMRKNLSVDAKNLETDLFHNLDKNQYKKSDILNDGMSGFRISDSAPIPIENIVLCQKEDLLYDGGFNHINLLRESIQPGTMIQFEVELDSDVTGFQIADLYTYLDAMFSDYRENFASVFDEVLPKDMMRVNFDLKNNEALLYLGGGVGFPTKTVVSPLYDSIMEGEKVTANILDAQFQKSNQRERVKKTGIAPQTLKCTQYKGAHYEMGLCKIRFEERRTK